MLTNVILEEELGNKFTTQFVSQVKSELKGCGSVVKLLSSLSPLANCLQFSSNSTVLSQIMLLLCHRFVTLFILIYQLRFSTFLLFFFSLSFSTQADTFFSSKVSLSLTTP